MYALQRLHAALNVKIYFNIVKSLKKLTKKAYFIRNRYNVNTEYSQPILHKNAPLYNENLGCLLKQVDSSLSQVEISNDYRRVDFPLV